jgi:hypothetical protein
MSEKRRVVNRPHRPKRGRVEGSKTTRPVQYRLKASVYDTDGLSTLQWCGAHAVSSKELLC